MRIETTSTNESIQALGLNITTKFVLSADAWRRAMFSRRTAMQPRGQRSMKFSYLNGVKGPTAEVPSQPYFRLEFGCEPALVTVETGQPCQNLVMTDMTKVKDLISHQMQNLGSSHLKPT